MNKVSIRKYIVKSKRGITGSIYAENLKQAKAIASAKGLRRSSVKPCKRR